MLHSIRARLVTMIALMATCVCAAMAAFFIPQQAKLADIALDREMKAAYESVQAAIDFERKAVLTLATYVGSMPELQTAFAAGDRDRLVALLGNSIEAVAKTFGYNLNTLSRAPGTVLVRIHNPKSFGDDITSRRKMVVRVNQEGTTESGIEPGANNLSIFGTFPVMHEGRRIGAFDVGMEIGKPFVDTVKTRFGIDIAIHIGEGNTFKTLISTLTEQTLGAAADYQSGAQGLTAVRHGTLNGSPVAISYGPIRNYSGATIGAIEIVKNTADLEAIRSRTQTYAIAVTAIVLLVSIVAALFLALGLSRPITRITATMSSLSAGNTATEVPGVGRKDEIGLMAGAVQVFKNNMIETERLRGEQEELKTRSEVEKRAAMNRMADEFEISVKGIVQTVSSAATELQTTAQAMSTTADETQRQSSAVAAASEEASTNVQTVASAAEELSSSIAEISRQVTESARIAGAAVTDAERTNTKVQTLADAAQKIGDVVKLINDIAGQTNLLALNATIEAARAGEAGRGFAVVASEVKNLASQTARATEDISAQIQNIQSATADSVQAIQDITGTISRINEIATTIASAVEEQGAATQEIARNVQQASAGTAEVSSNIVGVTKAANETGAASTQVLGSAGELSRQSETLRSEVDGFIVRIRAA